MRLRVDFVRGTWGLDNHPEEQCVFDDNILLMFPCRILFGRLCPFYYGPHPTTIKAITLASPVRELMAILYSIRLAAEKQKNRRSMPMHNRPIVAPRMTCTAF
jgi:hypothetical protein